MRIIAGRWRGTALTPVDTGDEAARLRPTTDRVRESLFNLLAHGSGYTPIEGANVLDLFAGTGALGLEALSRGAAAVTFVDSGRPAQRLLRANLDRLRGATEAARILPRDAASLGANPDDPATLVFLDPPYTRGLGERAVAAALAGSWIAPGATVVWEERIQPAAPPALTLRDRRQYGDTMISIFEATGA